MPEGGTGDAEGGERDAEGGEKERRVHLTGFFTLTGV